VCIGCHIGGGCEGDPEFETNDLLTCCDATQMMGSFRNEIGECFILTGVLNVISI